MSDGRAGDVARVDQLLRTAGRDGAVPLPELSAAELCTLCDGGQVLVEHAEYAWWYGLQPGVRKTLAGAAVSLLGFRELLCPAETVRDANHADGPTADGTVPLATAPELSLIIAARQRPAVLAVGTIGGDATAGTPRMYGLAGPDGRPQAVVAEQVTSEVTDPFGPLHRFALLSPARAADTLADWACQAGPDREISVYRHREGEPLTCEIATVTTRTGTRTVTWQGPGTVPGQPVPCDPARLARLAAVMLNGEA